MAVPCHPDRSGIGFEVVRTDEEFLERVRIFMGLEPTTFHSSVTFHWRTPNGLNYSMTGST